jgi:type II secretory pathway component GspD/PulD (secretin)
VHHDGLIQLKAHNVWAIEVFEDLAKATGYNFHYNCNIDYKITSELHGYDPLYIIDEFTYQNSLLAIKEQNSFQIFSFKENAGIDKKFIYIYSPRSSDIKLLDKYIRNFSLNAKLTGYSEINAYIISGTVPEIEEAVKALRIIDSRPKQVSIELLIVEYKHGKEFEWGFDIVNGTYGRTGDINYLPGSSGIKGQDVISATYNFISKLKPNFKVNLQALIANDLANVVTNPHVVVLNGEIAKIDIKEKRFIVLQTATINGITTTLEKLDGGISLHVTPTIMQDDLVMLDLLGSNSIFLTDVGENNYTMQSNDLTTKISVKNGETLVIGGLIQNEATNKRAGVPLISRIPLLGLLFKNINKNDSYSETVLYITPYIGPLQNPKFESNYEEIKHLNRKLKKENIRLERRGIRNLFK